MVFADLLPLLATICAALSYVSHWLVAWRALDFFLDVPPTGDAEGDTRDPGALPPQHSSRSSAGITKWTIFYPPLIRHAFCACLTPALARQG